MAQQVQSIWLKTVLENESFEQSINNSSSINFKRIIQPELSSITTQEWKNTLRANKKLTEQYSRIKKESAGFKSRLLEYQENFTEYMVRNGELRDENARLQGEIRILNSKVEAMKDAMDHAVGLFLPFCDTSIRSNEVSLRQEEISHQSNHSSALQSDEIDSRRTSAFSTESRDHDFEQNQTKTEDPEQTVEIAEESGCDQPTLDESHLDDSSDFDSDESADFQFNVRKSMKITAEEKMRRKTMRKTMRKTQLKKRESVAKRESNAGKPGRPSLVDKRKSSAAEQKSKNRKSVTIQSPPQEPKRRSSRIAQNHNDSVTETTLNETSDLNVTKRRAKRGSTVVLSDFEASNSLLDSTCMPESFNLGPVQSPEPETKATEEPLEPEPIPEPVVVKAVSKPKRKYKKKSKIVADPECDPDKENTAMVVKTPTKPPPSPSPLTNTGRPSRRARKQVSYREDDGISKLRRGDKMSDSSLYTSFSPKRQRKL